jgi:hypothetical protein
MKLVTFGSNGSAVVERGVNGRNAFGAVADWTKDGPGGVAQPRRPLLREVYTASRPALSGLFGRNGRPFREELRVPYQRARRRVKAWSCRTQRPLPQQCECLDQLGFRGAGVTGTEQFVHFVLDHPEEG